MKSGRLGASEFGRAASRVLALRGAPARGVAPTSALFSPTSAGKAVVEVPGDMKGVTSVLNYLAALGVVSGAAFLVWFALDNVGHG